MEEEAKTITEQLYNKYLESTEDQQAAAMLVLADTISTGVSKFIDSFGHEICMGIRHGLFGANAQGNEDIGSLDNLASAISELSDGFEEIAKASSEKK